MLISYQKGFMEIKKTINTNNKLNLTNSESMYPDKNSNNLKSIPSFTSAWYIWGQGNKTIVLEECEKGNDKELLFDFVKNVESEKLENLINKFLNNTIISNSELQTNYGNIKAKIDTSKADVKEQIASYILGELAQYKPVDINVGKENYKKFKEECKDLRLKVRDKDPQNGILTIQIIQPPPELIPVKGTEELWDAISTVELTNNGNNLDRSKIINKMLDNQEKINKASLSTINGWLKAASIGIAANGEGSLLTDTRDKLLKAYLKFPEAKKQSLYPLVKSLCQQLPSAQTGDKIVRIPNKGPVRHGILALKSAALRSDKWSEIGDKGVFIKAIHQLAHQRPAPELGHVCIAFAEYIRSNGNIAAFDKSLEESNVSFEDYFVKYGNEIKGNSDWNNISVNKPSIVPQFSDEQVRRALEGHGWLDRNKYNINELMKRPEPRLATFFQVYGETIIDTLKGMGIELNTGSDNYQKYLDKKVLEQIDHVNVLRKDIFDSNKYDEKTKIKTVYPQLLKETTEIRKFLDTAISLTDDYKKLDVLIELDNNLENLVNTVSMNILAKARSKNGLYELDNNTEKLLIALIDNYILTNKEDSLLLNKIKSTINKAFTESDQSSEIWAEYILVPLAQLQRYITEKSNDISDTYRVIATNLSRLNASKIDRNKSIEQLADGIIRGSSLFDISQIVTGFKAEARKLAGLSPWQVLSSGNTAGQIIHAKDMIHLDQIIKQHDFGPKDKLICMVDHLEGAEEPPKVVSAIITPKVIDTLSHLGVRCRQENIAFACLDDHIIYQDLKNDYKHLSSYAQIDLNEAQNNIRQIDKAKYQEYITKSNKQSSHLQVTLPEADLKYKNSVTHLDEMTFNTCGPKATNISRLSKAVQVPESVSIPFAVFEKVFNAPENTQTVKEYYETLEILAIKQKEKDLTLVNELDKLKQLTERLQFPIAIEKEIVESVKNTLPEEAKYLITRSSTNGEDLKDFSGAGLYESYPGVPKSMITDYIKKVWASKWNKRAYDARVNAKIPHKDLYVSVLIQPTIEAKYGFVTHTVNPITNNLDEVLIDIVQGLGEALVSGEIAGKGYGFIYNKKNDTVKRIHLADKTYQLVPDGKGGLEKTLTNYDKDKFAGQKYQWEKEIKDIGRNSVKIENMYDGVAQDIEGCISNTNEKLYFVQTRDQLGLKNAQKTNISFGSMLSEKNPDNTFKTRHYLNILV